MTYEGVHHVGFSNEAVKRHVRAALAFAAQPLNHALGLERRQQTAATPLIHQRLFGQRACTRIGVGAQLVLVVVGERIEHQLLELGDKLPAGTGAQLFRVQCCPMTHNASPRAASRLSQRLVIPHLNDAHLNQGRFQATPAASGATSQFVPSTPASAPGAPAARATHGGADHDTRVASAATAQCARRRDRECRTGAGCSPQSRA
jgi:hypothetical protein